MRLAGCQACDACVAARLQPLQRILLYARLSNAATEGVQCLPPKYSTTSAAAALRRRAGKRAKVHQSQMSSRLPTLLGCLALLLAAAPAARCAPRVSTAASAGRAFAAAARAVDAGGSLTVTGGHDQLQDGATFMCQPGHMRAGVRLRLRHAPTALPAMLDRVPCSKDVPD